MGDTLGIVADKSAIQFKMLNLSKGPAMWSPRTQNDRMLLLQNGDQCWSRHQIWISSRIW